MPCYHPLKARQRYAGGPLFFGPHYRLGDRFLEVPCGQCVGCRLEFCRQWAVRCIHESRMHDVSCFATFTYDDEHLPADGSLCHAHFVAMFKRLREQLRFQGKPLIRFFMGGEYGEKYSRPHYHALIFGFTPEDRVFWKKSDAGFDCYTSNYLDKVWRFGRVYVGDVTFESASYVARYCMKKVGSDGPRREILDVITGEIITRAHEYGKMSLRPGLGASYITKYGRDVFMNDRVIVNGKDSPLPRYYDVLLERVSPLLLAEHKALRVSRADAKYQRLCEERPADIKIGDERRLKVHEAVKKASINLLKRGE